MKLSVERYSIFGSFLSLNYPLNYDKSELGISYDNFRFNICLYLLKYDFLLSLRFATIIFYIIFFKLEK